MEMASYFHILMPPGHFHVVLDAASCYLNLSNMAEETRSYNLGNAADFQLTEFNIHLECLFLL